MRILFADDVKDTRDIFALIFANEGFETHTADNGSEAVALVEQSSEPFDVIVLDVEMPIMDGWEALEAIRSLPQGREVPVILFTAYGSPEMRMLALEAGAKELVRKPILGHDMIHHIYAASRRAPSERSA